MLEEPEGRSHFRVLGIPVRVEWPFLIVAGVLGLDIADGWLLAAWVGIVVVSVLVHELGHAIAYRFLRQRPRVVITMVCGMTYGERPLSAVPSVFVGLAGSALGLAALWLPSSIARDGNWALSHPNGYSVLYLVAFVNLWLSIGELLPLRPLDGGHIAETLMGVSRARYLSVATGVVAGLVVLVAGYEYPGIYLLLLAAWNVAEVVQERRGAWNQSMFRGPWQPREPPAPRPKRGRASRRDKPAKGRPPDKATGPAAGKGKGRRRSPARLHAVPDLADGAPDAMAGWMSAYLSPSPPGLALARVVSEAGQADALAERLLASDPGGVDAASTLATHLHSSGCYGDAAAVGERLVADGRANQAQTMFEVACAWSQAGRPEDGLRWLERAVRAGFKAPNLLDHEPDLAPVRELSGYSAVRDQASA